MAIPVALFTLPPPRYGGVGYIHLFTFYVYYVYVVVIVAIWFITVYVWFITGYLTTLLHARYGCCTHVRRLRLVAVVGFWLVAPRLRLPLLIYVT